MFHIHPPVSETKLTQGLIDCSGLGVRRLIFSWIHFLHVVRWARGTCPLYCGHEHHNNTISRLVATHCSRLSLRWDSGLVVTCLLEQCTTICWNRTYGGSNDTSKISLTSVFILNFQYCVVGNVEAFVELGKLNFWANMCIIHDNLCTLQQS